MLVKGATAVDIRLDNRQHIINIFHIISYVTDRYFAGPLDNWSTLHRQITYHFTAKDCVQSPAMESNHDTIYLSATIMDLRMNIWAI